MVVCYAGVAALRPREQSTVAGDGSGIWSQGGLEASDGSLDAVHAFPRTCDI